MEAPLLDTTVPTPRVKVVFRIGSENYSVNSDTGILSEQLLLLKGESMGILKDFITRHNAPIDVPDDPDEVSEDDAETLEKPKLKKRK